MTRHDERCYYGAITVGVNAGRSAYLYPLTLRLLIISTAGHTSLQALIFSDHHAQRLRCIDAPPAAVWATLSNLESIHLWSDVIQHSYCIGEGP